MQFDVWRFQSPEMQLQESERWESIVSIVSYHDYTYIEHELLMFKCIVIQKVCVIITKCCAMMQAECLEIYS